MHCVYCIIAFIVYTLGEINVKLKTSIKAAVLSALALSNFSHAAGNFTNGGFETGTITGWTQGGGLWNPAGGAPLDPALYIPGGSRYNLSNSVVTVVSSGDDPLIGAALHTTYSGNYALKINDDINNYSVSTISQTVNNYGSSSINFSWATVLEGGGHTAAQASHFVILVKDNTTGQIKANIAYTSGTSPGVDFNGTATFTTSGGYVYSGWNNEAITVDSGHSYTLTLLVSDCSAGGHWGYVYLDGFATVAGGASIVGPDSNDTNLALLSQSRQLRSAFNTQTAAANFALNYDCNIFDVKGLCISAGGRYTTIDNPGINNEAAVVQLGYKVNPHIRIGAYLDQNVNISKPNGIHISNNTPLMGLYAVWNKEESGLGYQVRLANTYQDKDVTLTRTVFNTS